MVVSSMWQIFKETGKHNGKPIDVWYVSPAPFKYGFASFTDEGAAYQYLSEVNASESEKRGPQPITVW
jgi:hypothetical protein